MADELERALRARDLELMAQPRNPNAVRPVNPGLLDLPGGAVERLALLNQIFNPVEAIGQSMEAGSRLTASDTAAMDRLAALGDMLSGVAGVAGPAVAAGRAGIPAATAVMEGLLGASPTTQAAGDMARQFAEEEAGSVNLGGLHNALARIRDEARNMSVPYTTRGADFFQAPRTGGGRAKDPALYTPYSSLRQDVPPSEWEVSGREFVGLAENPQFVTPERLEGATLFGYTADPTMTNRTIESLNQAQFEAPVMQQGGHVFVDEPGRGFASELAAMRAKQLAWDRARAEGKRPVVTPMVMGTASGDASQHVSQTLVRAIQANADKVDPKFVPSLPAKLQEDYSKNISKKLGLLDPRLPAWLESKSGSERAAFVKALDKSPAAKAGVPSVAAVRWATTDPNLMGAGLLDSGYRLFEPSAGPLDVHGGELHSTYNAVINREGPSMTMGNTTRPWYLMFPDAAYEKMLASTPPGANMLNPTAMPKDLRAFQMNPKVSQELDAEWVDMNSRYDEILATQGKEAADLYALDAMTARAARRGL